MRVVAIVVSCLGANGHFRPLHSHLKIFPFQNPYTVNNRNLLSSERPISLYLLSSLLFLVLFFCLVLVVLSSLLLFLFLHLFFSFIILSVKFSPPDAMLLCSTSDLWSIFHIRFRKKNHTVKLLNYGFVDFIHDFTFIALKRKS